MKSYSSVAALLILAATSFAQPGSDYLKQEFRNPPTSARPRVWWHWMNGNVTREGIALDLEWMHRIGIGGFQNFDAAMNTPKVVNHRLVYMSPEWKQTFLYATKLADHLGLEEAIASSPGWSETGGPWVRPSEGMKKYVWSETRVSGGRLFDGKLTLPPNTTGPFQDIPFVPDAVMPGDKSPDIPASFYRDSQVFAYQLPKTDESILQLHPLITTSSGSIDPALLTDGDYARPVELPSASVGKQAWIQYEFAKPTTIQSVMFVLASPALPLTASNNHGESEVFLESSDDGENFHRVTQLEAGDVGTTLDISPITAKYFRVAFLATAPHPALSLEEDPDGWMGVHVPRTDDPHFERITELVLSPAPRVNHFEDKAAFGTADDLYRFATLPTRPKDSIDRRDVIDLTAKMQSDGTLQWTPPAGNWVIVRMGYSLLGITNHPATAEATGLEVDKLNRTYVKSYMDHYLDSYKSAVGTQWMGKHGVRYVVTDSWEAGAQNWTDNILAEFSKRRGYDPRPYLPVLTGHLVTSAEASDAFLWDFRKTIADLTADEHYAQVEASLKERGLGHYGESHESGRALIADGMEVKKLDDIPMSAMWTQRPGVNEELYGYNADDRESASVAHIYGQNLAAAESMTAVHAPWAWSPASLKPTADKELAEGINRFVIHCSVHQPLVGKAPGLGLGPYGQWFNRNETWAEEAKPWVDYLSRSSYLLQQGHFVADILYFYGEDSNVTAIFGNKSPDIPEGYGFDFVNADALLHMLTVRNGKLETASGMSYQVLALDPYSEHMSLPVLQSIRKLVENGATVVGAKPAGTPSLADDPYEFATIVNELWGSGPGVRTVGRGRVYAGMTIAEAMHAIKVQADFSYSKPRPDTKLLFVHRRLSHGDLYYVDNRSDHDQSVDAVFRVTGKSPELWHAETGKTEPASFIISGDHTNVPLTLEPWGTAFVVFRHGTNRTSLALPVMQDKSVATLQGPWRVSFQRERGAPAPIEMPKLASWSVNPDEGVRYFSGSGTYQKTFVAPPDWFASKGQLWLDLGDVRNLATVTLNGKPLGTLWHAPYRVEIGSAIRPGRNELLIKVTNSWVNRIIGDLQPDIPKQYTFTVIRPYAADSPLLSSGLLGPVTVLERGPNGVE